MVTSVTFHQGHTECSVKCAQGMFVRGCLPLNSMVSQTRPNHMADIFFRKDQRP